MQSGNQLLPLWAQVTLLLIPAVSAVLAACGLFLNVQQSRRTNTQARATLVAESLRGFADDADIQAAFYAIEYSDFVYDASFHKSDQERQVDKLLRHFANIAMAWQAGLLTTQDARPIQYYVLRIMRDAEIQKYLAFIEQWSSRAALGQHPYSVLEKLRQAFEH
jgi:hypothetical protein